MIIHPASQGTPEWQIARLGIPTASQFHQIITPKTRKPSASAAGYLYELLAEYFLGEPLDGASSGFMERGREMEEEAALWYELRQDVELTPVGLCLRDDKKVAASPDRLVGEDGLLEIKCLSAKLHVAALLGDPLEEYAIQMQGQLLVTERKWVDRLFYNPALPSMVTHQERDEGLIGVLGEEVDGFVARLDAAKARLRAEYGLEGKHEPG